MFSNYREGEKLRGNPDVYGGLLLSENLRKSNLSQVWFFFTLTKISFAI